MSFLFDKVSENPIIASIKDIEQLNIALDSPCEIIFLLTGNIFNLKEISNRVLKKDKGLFIYIDEIDGFSKDTWGLEYIVKNIPLNGIITSKQNLIKLSKDMGVFTIQRMFIPDSYSLTKGLENIKANRPHAVEVLPGIMPKIIERIIQNTRIPLIASGLIADYEDMITSLEAGAIAISTSNPRIWYNNRNQKI